MDKKNDGTENEESKCHHYKNPILINDIYIYIYIYIYIIYM